MKAKEIIDKLNLLPHPEGGHFRETFRADEYISADALPERYIGKRCFSTAIYFLLQSGENHKLHRLASDEIWHYYYGSPLKISFYSDLNDKKEMILGPNVINGEIPQILIPRNSWMVAKVIEDDSFTLVGCTVSPGFEFEDFEMSMTEK